MYAGSTTDSTHECRFVNTFQQHSFTHTDSIVQNWTKLRSTVWPYLLRVSAPGTANGIVRDLVNEDYTHSVSWKPFPKTNIAHFQLEQECGTTAFTRFHAYHVKWLPHFTATKLTSAAMASTFYKHKNGTSRQTEVPSFFFFFFSAEQLARCSTFEVA